MKNVNEKGATTSTVAKINNVEIVVIENGEKRIPVKPICDALGIDFSSQLQKLKSDPILSSTMVLNTTVGADEKQREMVTIPFKFVFGWLFRIDSRNVKPEAAEAVLRYQVECYEALYNHFTQYAEFVDWQMKQINEQVVAMEKINADFHEAKQRLIDAKAEFKRRRELTLADYLAAKAQLMLFQPEEMEG